MSGIVRRSLRLVTIAALSIVGVSHGVLAHGRQAPSPGSPAPQQATLVIINDSGKTLVPGKQKVEENGKALVNLPRRTYQRLLLAPGQHVLRLPHQRKPTLTLDMEAGRIYFVVVAYKPERSYAFPLAGSPLVLGQISEEEARALMATMTEHVER